MHVVLWHEDGLDVGVEVVGREEDGLTANPEDLAEEIMGVERVGEGDRKQMEDAATVTVLVEAKHDRRARWEVGKSGGEENAGELDGAPPP